MLEKVMIIAAVLGSTLLWVLGITTFPRLAVFLGLLALALIIARIWRGVTEKEFYRH